MVFDVIQMLKDAGFKPENVFVLGVSGGADSMFLLDLMVKAKLNCVVAHFNHQIRLDAGEDASFVEKVTQKYGVPFFFGTSDVPLLAKKEHLSIEEAARKSRYRYLFKIAAEQAAQAVVVAHHADDQVETVLMHFLRGAGLDGLKGMKPVTLLSEFHPTIPIFRPLLSIRRDEIEKYNVLNQIQSTVDETNTDTAYLRNKLRHELVPQLEWEYPGFQRRLANMTNILQADADIISQAVQNAWQVVNVQSGKGFIQLDKHNFLQQPTGVQRRILRFALNNLQPELRDISFSMIDRAIENITQYSTGEFDLINRLSLILYHSDFFIVRKEIEWYETLFPQVYSSQPLILPAPGVYAIHAEWQISIQHDSAESLDSFSKDQNHVFVDAEKSGKFPWKVRNWQPGDRFRPFGMSHGKMKLGHLFINEKILKPARKNWPILVNQQGQIIWVVGLRADDRFRVTASTNAVIEVRLKRKS